MEKIKYKKWILSVALMTSTVLFFMTFITYILDPYMYYRVDDSKRLLNTRFVTAGLIKNSEYDTAIVGSSLIQNFDMNSFRNKLGWNPLKLTVGGMTTKEQVQMVNMASKTNNPDRFILNIPLDVNYNDKTRDDIFPVYLYNSYYLDDIKYLFGYEVWTRYIPINTILNCASKTGADLSGFSIKVDLMGDWSKEVEPGREIVIEGYQENGIHEPNISKYAILSNMKNVIDIFHDEIKTQIQNEKEFIFIFPPYSALYWSDMKEKDLYSEFIIAKKYFLYKFSEYSNVRIIDMQDCEKISNLNYYIDSIHYHTTIQKDMLDAIISKQYDLNRENFSSKSNNLDMIVTKFIQDNNDWLKVN
ncbi:MAG: hypothetical protein ABF289_08165 [Clostridiales bacterium]